MAAVVFQDALEKKNAPVITLVTNKKTAENAMDVDGDIQMVMHLKTILHN